MRNLALTLLLLGTALPASAQQPPPPVPPTTDVQSRADASLVQALQILMAGQRSSASPLLLATLGALAPPADVAAIRAGDNQPVFQRWLVARSAAFKAKDWQQGAYWNQLIAAYLLGNVALDGAADAGPITGETFGDVHFLIYALAMSGQYDRATALARPFLAARDPQFEAALAADLAQRVSSVDAWGGVDRPKAAPLLAWALALFDRPDARAPDQVRALLYRDAEIRRMSGDLAGAQAAYARARKPGAALTDPELALLFATGAGEAGTRAVQQSLGETPGAPLSRKAVDKLISLTGVTGSGNQVSIAILRVAVPAYRRLTKLDDRALEDGISQLAGALYDAGDAAQAEPLLAELFGYYERRFGFDTAGANRYAARLAQAMVAQSRYDEADLLYRRLWALVEKYQAYDDDDAQRYAQGIAGILAARGQSDAAIAFNGDALARARKAQAPDAGVLAAYLTVQARLLTSADRLDDAERAAREAIALGPSDDKFVITAIFDNPPALARAQLASLLEARGRAAEAEPLRRLLLRRVEEVEMIQWEGDLRREAILALANNLTLQGKAEGRTLFGERMARNRRIFGGDSPQLLAIAEPFARALLRAGRAGEALPPARVALAARTSSRFLGDTSGIAQTALARRRREAARLLVEAAWRASRPG